MNENTQNQGKMPHDQPTVEYGGTALGPGAQIGQFRIEQELGRGAMGIVYLAHDCKLNRKVAIKSLPAEFMANPKARSRFSREARTLASLNHPNIATIHDELEESEGIVYLILEYIPGKTLAEHIAKGGIKLQESLSIALQIAEAVSAAHDHDVIHRDLKPENIKITSEGKIKVLDFGLAKVVGIGAVDQHSTITEPGRVLGTPAYMSPEQARGQKTDKRSDIWAFGCILFEMLTATIPFRGETISDTLANILQTEPDWQEIPENTPNNVKVLIRRCMEKDQHKRLRDIGDAALEIRETMHQPPVPPVTNTSEVSQTSRKSFKLKMAIPWILVFLLALALIWHLNKGKANQVNQPEHFNISMNKDAPFEPIGNVTLNYALPALAISPDGKTLVYVAKVSDDTMLYKRCIDSSSFENEPLPGTEGAFHPFFSPDGHWVGFFTEEKLKKVSMQNNSIVPIVDVTSPLGADWGTDGNILVSQELGNTLSLVNETSGEFKRIPLGIDKEGDSDYFACPEILPGGETALTCGVYKGGIAAVDLMTGKARIIHVNGTNPKYAKNGYLLFARDGVLHAVKFDVDKLELIGTEIPISLDARVESPLGCIQMDISDTGTLVYSPGKSLLQSQFVWRHRTGKEKELNIKKKEFAHFCLSPDGEKLAVQVGKNRTSEIWIYRDIDSSQPKATKIGKGFYQFWSSDSDSILYGSEDGETFKILKQSISRTDDEPSVLFISKKEWIGGSLLSHDDNNWICNTPSGICIRDLANEKINKVLVGDGFLDSISRDEKYIGFISKRSGLFEAYVTSFPETGDIIQISSGGGDPIIWSKDRDELYYRNNTKFYQLSYTTDPGFKITSEPNELFDGDYLNINGVDFVVSNDGENFLLLKSMDEDYDAYRLNVITNWFEEEVFE